MKIIRLAEWIVAIVLTVTILALLVGRAQHAGGLWRDECASVQLAEMPAVSELFANFQRESFPAAFPLIIRAYSAVFGTSNAAFRAFGFAVGVLFLCVVWTNSTLLRREPPLISMALLGLNTTFLIWGTTMRGYGIGSVLILLTFGLVAGMLLKPTRPRMAAALFAALASVHVLLYNSVILMAITAGALAVCLSRREWRPALAIAGIAIACAVSMLPYLGPFWHESRSTVVLQAPLDFAWLWSRLQLAFGRPPQVMTVVWLAPLLAAISGAVVRLSVIWSKKTAPEWELLLFGLLVPLITLGGYLAFLEMLRYATREWYYLALLSILAGASDLLVATLARSYWIRGARVVFTAVVLVALPFFNWPEIMKRQTNVDLVARELEQSAQARDLIVVNPWYYGVTFNWYYRGPTLWVTVPLMSDHRVHRFDLLKAKMMSPHPIDDLYEVIGGALKAGDRVWFVGGVWFLPEGEAAGDLPPAPDSEFGWSLDAYSELWSKQIGVFLRNHASGGELINVPTGNPVNELENVDLLVVQGWHD